MFSNWGCETAQVFRVDFWMQIFKSKSPKPTSIVSSSPSIKTLLGPGVKRKSSANPTCRKYIDSEGKTRYHGTPELKCTQTLVESLVWCQIVSLQTKDITGPLNLRQLLVEFPVAHLRTYSPKIENNQANILGSSYDFPSHYLCHQ